VSPQLQSLGARKLDPSHPTNEMNFRGNCGHNEVS
jgi:hypothetical protein